MASIEANVRKHLALEGITLDFIGWADTFGFDQEIQASINDKFKTEKLASSMAILNALAMIDVQKGLGKGLENHGLPLAITPGMMEMIGSLVPRPSIPDLVKSAVAPQK